jgi:hypothetical protein
VHPIPCSVPVCGGEEGGLYLSALWSRGWGSLTGVHIIENLFTSFKALRAIIINHFDDTKGALSSFSMVKGLAGGPGRA